MRTSLKFCSTILALSAALAAMPATPALANGDRTDNTVTITDGVAGPYLGWKIFDGNFMEDSYTPAPNKPGYGNYGITPNKMGDLSLNKDLSKNGFDFQAQLTTILNKYLPNEKKITLVADAQKNAELLANGFKNAMEAGDWGFANEIAGVLIANNITPTVSKTSTSDTVSFTDLKTGYYIFAADTRNPENYSNNKAVTSAILTPVIGNVSIKSKVNVPTVEKSVKDNTPGTDFDGDYGKMAIAGLIADGNLPKIDSVTYKIDGTISRNIEDFETYKYVLHDTLPTGLDVTADELKAGGSWKLTIKAIDPTHANGVDITSSFTPTVETTGTGKSRVSKISIASNDLKEALKKAGISLNYDNASQIHIVAEYTPVYDENDITNLYANYGQAHAGQKNSVYIEYSNNPYTGGTPSTSTTPPNETLVYAIKLRVNKIKEGGGTLKNAQFTLTDKTTGKTIGKNVTAANDGTFFFTGLDAGHVYVLTESVVPNGYKSVDPIEFSIKAVQGADKKTVASIQVEGIKDPSHASQFVVNNSTLEVTANITNIPGPNMPGTGTGQQTAGIVLAGGLLILSIYFLRPRETD